MIRQLPSFDVKTAKIVSRCCLIAFEYGAHPRPMFCICEAFGIAVFSDSRPGSDVSQLQLASQSNAMSACEISVVRKHVKPLASYIWPKLRKLTVLAL